MRYGDWIRTFSGKRFYPLDPREDEVDIVDIAHALSLSCRFGGHCNEFYSVAQHSLIVSAMLPDTHKLAGLLHDASEAYISDITRPVKPFLNNYKNIERSIQDVIFAKFGVTNGYDEIVKEVDNKVLFTEAKQFMNGGTDDWANKVDSYSFEIDPSSPSLSKNAFLYEFERLTDGRNLLRK